MRMGRSSRIGATADHRRVIRALAVLVLLLLAIPRVRCSATGDAGSLRRVRLGKSRVMGETKSVAPDSVVDTFAIRIRDRLAPPAPDRAEIR